MKCKICNKEIEGKEYKIKAMVNEYSYPSSIDLKEWEYSICGDCYKDLLSRQQSSVIVSTRGEING